MSDRPIPRMIMDSKEYHTSYRDRCRVEGRCTKCVQPVAPTSKSLCVRHLRIQNEHGRKNRARKKAARLCLDCGKPAGDRYARCIHCRMERAKWMRSYRRGGLPEIEIPDTRAEETQPIEYEVMD